MLSGIVAMCDTYTINVYSIYSDMAVEVVRSKTICLILLVANSPSTYFLISDSMNWEGGWHTPRTTIWSPTCPLWWSDCSEALWTVVVGVSHVEVGHPHPSSSGTTTSPGHVAVNLICISTSRPLNPVVPRWAALFYVLTRWYRVLEGSIWKVLDCVLWVTTSNFLEGTVLFLYILQELLLQGYTFCTEKKLLVVKWQRVYLYLCKGVSIQVFSCPVPCFCSQPCFQAHLPVCMPGEEITGEWL